MTRLSGKVVLITGAASGIGLAAARALAAGGGAVIATDINAAALEENYSASDGAIRTLAQDVTSADDWARVVADVRSREGRLDALVNNAGVMLTKGFADTSLAEFRQVMTINVESIWLGCQAALPLLSETAGTSAHGGSIVNISSIYGQIAGPMHAAYCASKGAVRLLTKSLAVELAPKKIRVNSIHPGPVATPLGLGGLEDVVRSGRLPDLETAKAAVAQKFPLGRWAVADDIAGSIVFLASDDARFMTGSEMTIDGGFSTI